MFLFIRIIRFRLAINNVAKITPKQKPSNNLNDCGSQIICQKSVKSAIHGIGWLSQWRANSR